MERKKENERRPTSPSSQLSVLPIVPAERAPPPEKTNRLGVQGLWLKDRNLWFPDHEP